jgi:hypothetical protein
MRWFFWITLAALAFACSSSGDSGEVASSTTGTDGTEASSAAESSDGTDGTEAGTATSDGVDGVTAKKCLDKVRPYGYASTEIGDIVYANQGLTFNATHGSGDTCTNSISVTYDIDGGCVLSFEAFTTGGFWKLTGGSFAADGKCGAFWDDTDEVTFELSVEDSRFGVRSAPDVSDSAEGQCGAIVDDDPMLMTGYLRFVAKGAASDGQDRALQLGINDLGIRGSYLAEESESAECPAEPRLCQGIECGLDYFGAECGGCEKQGLSCIGGTCVEGGCQPNSTKTALGDAIGDQTYTTSTGEEFNLHSACEAPAVFMLKTAFW